MNIKIRKAEKKDFKNIVRLIKELAKFEKLAPPNKTAVERLYKHGFGKDKKYNVIVADSGRDIVGYAFYIFTYSTFLAKPTLYLEDIYISEKYRNSGVGKLFWNELIKISKKNKCGRMEWIVLDWNRNAIKFYDKLGANDMREWRFYRYTL
jgi:ribosomal protein S18 acetylase RimI-like enzyme